MLYALPLMVFGMAAIASNGKRRFISMLLVLITVMMGTGIYEVIL